MRQSKQLFRVGVKKIIDQGHAAGQDSQSHATSGLRLASLLMPENFRVYCTEKIIHASFFVDDKNHD